LIRGDLFNLEILRLRLDTAADAGQVGCQQRGRGERIE
jgi:hypothetical protein